MSQLERKVARLRKLGRTGCVMTTDELEQLSRLVHCVEVARKLAKRAQASLMDHDLEMVSSFLRQIEALTDASVEKEQVMDDSAVSRR